MPVFVFYSQMSEKQKKATRKKFSSPYRATKSGKPYWYRLNANMEPVKRSPVLKTIA
jgi:hypothetical protein